jgi:hypothetical protein
MASLSSWIAAEMVLMPTGPPLNFSMIGEKDLSVDLVESVTDRLRGGRGRRSATAEVDRAVVHDFSKVADTTEEPIGDARSAAGA